MYCINLYMHVFLYIFAFKKASVFACSFMFIFCVWRIYFISLFFFIFLLICSLFIRIFFLFILLTLLNVYLFPRLAGWLSVCTALLDLFNRRPMRQRPPPLTHPKNFNHTVACFLALQKFTQAKKFK